MSSVLNMKDTKYEWIGSIPVDWKLKKIKYIFWDRKENNNPIKSENLISLTIEKGVIPHSEKTGGGNKPKDDLSKYKLVYPGDIVLNSMNVIAGAVGISKYFGVVSPVYYMLIPRDVDHSNEYFHHLFRTEIFQKSLYGLGNGILIKENEETGKLNTIRMRIPMDKLGQQFIPVPPSEEQKLISRYLDNKIKPIDRLVAKIQRKIKLLKEQRKSTINQYVTKGLDPNVELKDSGVDWIGEIPKHWDVRRLKFVSNHISEKRLPINGDIKISPENVESETGKIINYYSDYDTEGQIFQSGDILFNKLRVYLNKVILCDFDGLSMGEMIVIRPVYIEGNFLHRILNSNGFINHVNSLSEGVKLPRPSVSRILDTFIPIPPENDQINICETIHTNLGQIDKIITKNSERIRLVQEYRQSLISSVVTGKVRVTEDMV